MGSEFLELVANIFVDVLESVEEGRGNGGSAGAILDTRAKVLLSGLHEAAIGVIDDHELLGSEEVVRDQEGAERIVGNDATGVADDVRVAGLEAECADREARIHASEDCELALGTRGEAAELVGAGVLLVGDEDFVDDGHGD